MSNSTTSVVPPSDALDAARIEIGRKSPQSPVEHGRHPAIARTVFSVLVLCALMFGAAWIMIPFAAAIIWATTIVVATWPVLLSLQKRFNGSRAWATTVMTIILLSVFFVPFIAAIWTIVGSADEITLKMKTLLVMQVPPPPAWVGNLPLVGAKAAAAWQNFAGDGAKDLAGLLAPYANTIIKWTVAKMGGIGAALAQFLLTAIVAAVFYSNGEVAAAKVRMFGRKLAGERGDNVIRLAGQAIRGIALGVVVTAVGQAVLTGIGLAIAGIPFAALLAVVAFILCIAQIGPLLVLVPAVIWLYSTGHAGWGTFLLVWTLTVGTADNFVRPMLIKKGADLPLLLIFTGVIGGLVSMGLIGIFVGPVVLAVAHTLMEGWLAEQENVPTAA